MNRVVAVLPIDEYAAAVRFYIDGLGFEIEFEHRFEPGFPVQMGIRHGELFMHLSEHARGQGGFEVYVFVDDLAPWTERVIKAGITPVAGPIVQSWGATELVLRDPFDNTLRFSQPTPTATP